MQNFRVRHWPIRSEQSNHPLIDKALRPISSAYDATLVAREQRIAPSFVWRSESEFIADPKLSRFCHRVHLFELSGVDPPLEEIEPPEVDPLIEDHRVMYRGFIHLRPPDSNENENASWISDAMLIPPERYRRAPWHLAGLGTYAEFYDGGHFECLPYSMPMESTGGLCAHACLFQVTVAATRFGAIPLAPFDVTIVAHEADGEGTRHVRGLTPDDMVFALNSRHTGSITAVHESKSHLKSSPLLARGKNFLRLRVLPYLESALPVILCVDFNKLYGNDGRRKLGMPDINAESPKPEPHAVVIIGFARDTKELRFLISDATFGPFLEFTLDQLADSLLWSDDHDATAAPHGLARERESCHAVIPVPHGIIGVEKIRVWLRDSDDDQWPWRFTLVSWAEVPRLLARAYLYRKGAISIHDNIHRAADAARELIREELTPRPDYLWLATRHVQLDEDREERVECIAFNAMELTPNRDGRVFPLFNTTWSPHLDSGTYVWMWSGRQQKMIDVSRKMGCE